MLGAVLDFENFDFIHKYSIWRDAILDTRFPIPEMRTDFHLSFTSPSHALDAVIDPRNDLPIPDHDLGEIVFLDLFAVVQPTVQTDLNGIALLDGLAGAQCFRKKLDTGLKHPVVSPLESASTDRM